MTDDTAVAGRGCTIRTHDSQVPIYIFYATLCDVVEVSIQSRVPLPGLEQAFDEAVAHLKGVSLGGLVNSLKPCATLGVDSTPSSNAVM